MAFPWFGSSFPSFAGFFWRYTLREDVAAVFNSKQTVFGEIYHQIPHSDWLYLHELVTWSGGSGEFQLEAGGAGLVDAEIASVAQRLVVALAHVLVVLTDLVQIVVLQVGIQ